MADKDIGSASFTVNFPLWLIFDPTCVSDVDAFSAEATLTPPITCASMQIEDRKCLLVFTAQDLAVAFRDANFSRYAVIPLSSHADLAKLLANFHEARHLAFDFNCVEGGTFIATRQELLSRIG